MKNHTEAPPPSCSLFNQPREIKPLPKITPPTNGTPTSAAAAEKVEPHCKGLRAAVFLFIRLCEDGATDAEIFKQFPSIAQNSLRPRRWELSHKIGAIVDSGEVRDGAIVWKAKQ